MRSPCVAALLLSVLVIGGCSTAQNSSGDFTPSRPDTLTVAVDAIPDPGFWEGTMRRPTGGFEYSLAHDLAARFGLKRVKTIRVPFARIIRGDLGGADAALSTITPSATREEVLDFSPGYLPAPPAILTLEGREVPDLQSARDLSWSVRRDSTNQTALESQIDPKLPPLLRDRLPESIADVLDQRSDATMMDLPSALAYSQRLKPRTEVAAQLPGNQQLAVALPEGSPNLQAVGSAIRHFKSNGTLADLAQRYFDTVVSGDTAANVPLLQTTRR